MSKALQEQVDKLFEATKDLTSLEEIEPHCEFFNEWLNTEADISLNSLGTKLSQVGFYKKFKSINLEQGKNAKSVPTHDKEGNVTGTQLKHYVLLLCGLTKEEWQQRNETSRVSDRITFTDSEGSKGQEVDPEKYLEVTGKLLESENPHELAVGLIASTGRRPHEILARGKFTAVEGENYQVMFEGQGKKRGEKPVLKIHTLFPASYVIERLHHLRRDASVKSLLQEVNSEFPKDTAAQNRAIENRRGNSLRRVVQEFFGGRETKEPLLNFRQGEDQNDCKALRAACAALVTERDCKGSVGSKMYFYGLFLGHIAPGAQLSDRDLRSLLTSLGYADYYLSKPVPFPSSPEKQTPVMIRVWDADAEVIKEWQKEWEVTNQQSVVSRLVESYQKRMEAGKELVEAKSKIAQLEAQVKQLQQDNNQLHQEKAEMKPIMQEPQQVTLNVTDLEVFLEKKITEVVEKALSQNMTVAPSSVSIQSVKAPTQSRPAAIKEDTAADWELKTNAELWGSKAKGAAVEKIRRSFAAITTYNDTLATGDNDRLAVTNQALRELSGVNGLVVGDWIKSHADEIITHNSKYGMENSKDPSKVETYYNKRHGQEKITSILSLINGELLDGEALKSKE